MHEFAKDSIREFLREEQGRLTTEESLFITGKEMVQIREIPVELICVRIPP